MIANLDGRQIYYAFNVLEKGKFSDGYYTKYKDSYDLLKELKDDKNDAYCVADQIEKYVYSQCFQLCHDTKLVKGPIPLCLRATTQWNIGESTPINGIITYWRDERVKFLVCLFDCRQKGWIVDDMEELEESMNDAVESVTGWGNIVRIISQDKLITRYRNLVQTEYQRGIHEGTSTIERIPYARYEETDILRSEYWDKIRGYSIW